MKSGKSRKENSVTASKRTGFRGNWQVKNAPVSKMSAASVLPKGSFGTTTRQVEIARDGRLVIPSDMRRELGLEDGGKVIVELKDGSIVIDTVSSRIRRLQALVRRFDKGSGSVVDEFIAEKKAEAARE